MPKVKNSMDNFANKFYATVTESGANTLTYSEIQTNINIMAKTAWVLHRLEWYVAPSVLAAIIAAGDAFQMALTASSVPTTLDLDQASTIDMLELSAQATANPESLQVIPQPYVRDFGALPGGGLIIAPRPLYIGAKGTSLAAAHSAEVRGYFTQRDLTKEDYYDLLDFYRLIS